MKNIKKDFKIGLPELEASVKQYVQNIELMRKRKHTNIVSGTFDLSEIVENVRRYEQHISSMQNHTDIASTTVAKMLEETKKGNESFMLQNTIQTKDIQYSLDEVKKMRACNDSKLYKGISNIFSSTPRMPILDVYASNNRGVIWENGKCGYFVQSNETSACNMLMNLISDGKGLRFVQEYTVGDNEDRVLRVNTKEIIVSGFCYYLLCHWGENIKELCASYIGKKYEKYKKKWSETNYPQEPDITRLTPEFIDALMNEEKVKFNNEKISQYLQESDNEKISKCMNIFFARMETIKGNPIEENKTVSQTPQQIIDVNTNKVNDTAPVQQSDSVKPQQRVIDVDTLKIYFKNSFKGGGNDSINYFNSFIEDLKMDRSAIEFAQIALLAHEGGKMSDRKPKGFTKWHKIFCECAQCEYVKYRPNKLQQHKGRGSIEKLFYYLY